MHQVKITAIKIKTKYWLPGTNYVNEIVESVKNILQDGDIVTISEKAISTAMGNLIDESQIEPGRLAKLLTSFWMRRLWGGPFGKLAKLRDHTIERLKKYPISEGAAHKQVALDHVGLLHALRHYSEGGIDASNLPYSYVCLPLKDPKRIADSIQIALDDVRNHLSVIIVDGDTTFSRRNLHIGPRNVPISGILYIGGFLTFLIGRKLNFTARSTPLVETGVFRNPDLVLTLANVSHRVRGHGAGRTVWDMAKRFGVGLTEVTWDMLRLVDHYPIAILRVKD
ncbi:MAG: coenzyme F420-0:L-glutamate ligase [Candidatus Bathyarchaeota archaeon]|nr:coenzyme F420-0:L-glutamate ligase [Candidatus Bathyarchaeota archaeon]